MKSILRILVSGLVPILGLVSCTHKAAETKDDTFRVNAPVISGIAMNGLGHALPSDGEISFKTVDGSKIVKIESTSSCVVDGKTITKSAYFTGVERVPLLDLIDESLWLRADVETISNVHCGFEFVAANENGSTHSLSVPPMSLVYIAKSESLLLKSPAPAANPIQVPLKLTKEAKLDLQVSDPDESLPRTFQVVCEHFENKASLLENQDSNAALLELLVGKTESSTIRLDARDSYHVQKCRLFTIVTDDNTRISTVKISSPVSFQFPFKTAVSLKVGEAFTNLNTANPPTIYQGAKFVSITIKNEGSAPAAYRFPFPNLTLAVHFLDKKTLFSQPKIDISLNWSGGGTSQLDLQTVGVGPGETAVFEATIATELHCYTWNFGASPFDPSEATVAGLTYAFTGQNPITQVINLDPRTKFIDEKAADLPVANQTTSGWIPAPLSNNLTQTLDASEVVRPRGPGIAQGCFTGAVPPLAL